MVLRRVLDLLEHGEHGFVGTASVCGPPQRGYASEMAA